MRKKRGPAAASGPARPGTGISAAAAPAMRPRSNWRRPNPASVWTIRVDQGGGLTISGSGSTEMRQRMMPGAKITAGWRMPVWLLMETTGQTATIFRPRVPSSGSSLLTSIDHWSKLRRNYERPEEIDHGCDGEPAQIYVDRRRCAERIAGDVEPHGRAAAAGRRRSVHAQFRHARPLDRVARPGRAVLAGLRRHRARSDL